MMFIMRLQHNIYILTSSVIIICFFFIAFVSAAYPAQAEITRLYEIVGHLDEINLREGWGLIDGYRWRLTNDFDTSHLPQSWVKQGGYKCSNRYIVVRYYVRLKVPVGESLLNIGEDRRSKRAREVINPEEVKILFEKGGQVFRIEILPA